MTGRPSQENGEAGRRTVPREVGPSDAGEIRGGVGHGHGRDGGGRSRRPQTLVAVTWEFSSDAPRPAQPG